MPISVVNTKKLIFRPNGGSTPPRGGVGGGGVYTPCRLDLHRGTSAAVQKNKTTESFECDHTTGPCPAELHRHALPPRPSSEAEIATSKYAGDGSLSVASALLSLQATDKKYAEMTEKTCHERVGQFQRLYVDATNA